MKKIALIISALFVLAACSEFEPVFITKYDDPAEYKPASLTATHTIKELAAMYKTGTPWKVDKNIIISGKVSTTDQPGNFYKSFYIQDQTGGIEIKVGKNALYNDFRPGQTVYVKCMGLTLGMYGYKSGGYGGQGMVQIGYSDPSGQYETSYLESQLIIDAHVLRGQVGELVKPEIVTEAQLPKSTDTQATNSHIGKLVTLKGLKYGNEVFALLYLDSQKDTKLSSNRIFLSDKTWNITTWAMSKDLMKKHLLAGDWDAAEIGNSGSTTGKVADHKGDGSYPTIEKAAYSVSQYFKLGSTEIQIRTSGYGKFCDYEIPADVLNGSKTINATGILTMYQGSIQFVVNSQADFTYSDGTPLYK